MCPFKLLNLLHSNRKRIYQPITPRVNIYTCRVKEDWRQKALVMYIWFWDCITVLRDISNYGENLLRRILFLIRQIAILLQNGMKLRHPKILQYLHLLKRSKELKIEITYWTNFVLQNRYRGTLNGGKKTETVTIFELKYIHISNLKISSENIFHFVEFFSSPVESIFSVWNIMVYREESIEDAYNF